MPGPKPKPTVLKKMQGTYRSDRAVSNEAKFPVPSRMPKPPDGLNEEGEKLWRVIGKQLLDVGLFTSADSVALEMLCMAYGRMKEADRLIILEGMVLKSSNGGYYQNPYLAIANRSWEQVRSMLSEFGLTPAERTRVMAAAVAPQETDLAELLFRQINND